MRKTVVALLGLLALLAAASGCTRFYWSKPGATQDQFVRDNRECVQQAAGALPPGRSAQPEAVETLYRSCLSARGYVRDKQVDPPPPGFYRGVEDTEEFIFAARAAAAAPRHTFEQQLTQLDDLKARGRITEEEYATMRRKLVDGVSPSALAPPSPAPTTIEEPLSLSGRWYGRDRSTLDIRSMGGRDLSWEWERSNDRGTVRATGGGTASGSQVMLLARFSTGSALGAAPVFNFTLTWDGPVLRGVSRGAGNLPVEVEFRRARP